MTMLSITASENNLLGRRTVLAAAMEMDHGTLSTGPFLIDKNLFGRRIDLRIRGDALFDRASLEDGKLVREGSASEIALSKPLWSLASEWAVGGAFKHRFDVQRAFRGTSLRTYDNSETSDVEMIPFVYRQKVISASVNATWQWGTWFKNQVSVGYNVTSQRPTPYPFEPEPDAATLAAFTRDVLPRSEVTTGPNLELSGLQPVFKTRRNLQTYDLGEDVRFGPDYSLLLWWQPPAPRRFGELVACERVDRLDVRIVYELGGAASSLRDLQPHHDVGVGIRWLIPQISRDLFRFDLAFPLDGQAAGTPRFIGGFESAF